MNTTISTSKNISSIGEHIGLEEGKSMITSHVISHPETSNSYLIGREIIEKILQQPNCSGIKFYDAISEQGKKTLVLVGIDNEGNAILKYSIINSSGSIDNKHAIVADRIKTGNINEDQDWWLVD